MLMWREKQESLDRMGPEHREHSLRRQISGCKNPFVPFQHGTDETTSFEPLHTLKDTDRQQRWVISVKIFVWPEIFIFQWEVSLRPQHHSWEGERRHSPQHGGRDWPPQRQGAGGDVPANETPLRSGQNFNMISVCDSPSSSHQSTPSIRGLECRFYHLILSRDQTSRLQNIFLLKTRKSKQKL